MFDNIAHRYDFLNHLLSLGIDRGWRRHTIAQLKDQQPSQILDLATGTADLALGLAATFPHAHIDGIDLSEEMIARGQIKVEKQGLDNILLRTGDAEQLDLPDNHYDAITIGFGIRNFGDLEAGLSEMHRVLKPGGRLVVLEFSEPRGWFFKPIFRLHFKYILPLYGRIISSDPKAYTYLFESVQSFPAYERLISILENQGFKSIKFKPLTFGVCCVYVVEK